MAEPLKRSFFGLPLATLQALLTNYLACLTAIAVGGQSYSMGGRSFSKAQLAEVKDTIRELQAAIDDAGASTSTGKSGRVRLSFTGLYDHRA